VLVLQRRRQQIGGPVHPVWRRPCLLGSPVEAVDEDDVGLGLRVLVDRCELEPVRVLIDGGLLVVLVSLPLLRRHGPQLQQARKGIHRQGSGDL
jgi:hypothetical protein